jgi:hypothetical protein
VQTYEAEEWRAQLERLRRLFVRSPGFSRNGSVPERPLEGVTTIAAPLPLHQLSVLQEDEERFYALVVLGQEAAKMKVGSVE